MDLAVRPSVKAPKASKVEDGVVLILAAAPAPLLVAPAP